MLLRATTYVFLSMVAFAALGCTGEEGRQGPQGPTGPEGPVGPQGDPGMDGQNGIDGTDGADGAPGQDGQNGVTSIGLQFIGRYASGFFDEGASEIVSYDVGTRQLFVVNARAGVIDVLDIADPAAPVLAGSIDVIAEIAANTGITTALGSVNSVAVQNGLVATVAAAVNNDEFGVVAFFMAADSSFLAAYEVGYQPDAVVLSPNGQIAVVADEGEPLDDYTVDPPGSVTVLDIATGVESATVTTLDFTDFNAGGPRAGELDPEIRIFGVKIGGVPSTVAEDLEPEYVAFSADSTQAYVTLQENNAIAVIDLVTPRIDSLFSLGFIDHARIGNELDVSNRDDRINIRNWPVWGMPQPDAIATYEFQGQTMLVLANEGDARDYGGFSEEERVGGLVLDPVAFPDAATLADDGNLGRLNVTTANGDTDGDGDFDRLFSYGSRSFSIFSASGERVFDSGNQFELITAFRLEDNFNANNDDNGGDARSDDKGCEPEALTVANIRGATFAFIGLERAGGIMVYNISNPHSPRFVQYIIDRDFSAAPDTPEAGDLGPESLLFIPANNSPIAADLLVVGNEVSGTTSIYRIDVVTE